MKRTLPRWPLLVIALPAAVAVWSGWVGLGTPCGFGIVHPLPRLVDGLTINTSTTLPVGVECYAAYAMGAWLTPGVPEAAKKFAKRSAIGSLALGVLGQIAYDPLSAAPAPHASWPVVVLVSSLPVIVLGFGAALSHRYAGEDAQPEAAPVDVPESVPDAPADAPTLPVTGALRSAPRTKPRSAVKPVKRAIKDKSPADFYAAELAAGKVPSQRRIRADLHVGEPKAQAIHAELTASLSDRAIMPAAIAA